MMIIKKNKGKFVVIIIKSKDVDYSLFCFQNYKFLEFERKSKKNLKGKKEAKNRLRFTSGTNFSFNNNNDDNNNARAAIYATCEAP